MSANDGIQRVRTLLHVAGQLGPPPPNIAVEMALTMAVTLLQSAADDPRSGRSQRWRASVERLAMQVDGLRTGEGA